MKKLYFVLFAWFILFASNTGFSQKNVNSTPSISKIAWTKGSPSWITFKPQVNVPGNQILLVYKAEFGLETNDEMKMIRQETDKIGFTHFRYQQYYKGVPVEGAVFIIHDKGGKAKSANGQIVKGLNVSNNAQIVPLVALNKAMQEVPSEKYVWQDNESQNMLKQLKNDPNASYYPVPELIVFDKKFSGNASSYKLAYKVEIYSLKPLVRKYIYIDANNGEVLHSINMIQHTDVNAVGVTKYNGNQPIVIDSTGPGAYRLREAGRGNGIITKSTQNGEDYVQAIDVTDDSVFFNSDDVAVNAHWAAEMTYDYYLNVFGRNSFDNNGAALLSYVHYSTGYANAFWDGQRMTYGDGDGTYSAFTSLEICGHEITHAVTEHTANLVYQDESGALNESFSDMFGTSIEFMADATPNWLIGEDIGSAFRSMSNPNDYQNPDTYLGTYWDLDPNNMDNGGVHTNSGVANYWFYLLCEGGSGTNDNGDAFNVTALGHVTAENIAYQTLAYFLTPSANYYDAYQATLQAAQNIYGNCSNEAYQTANAWAAVGVGYPYDPQKVYVVNVTSPATSCGLGLEAVSALLFYNGCNSSLPANDTISLAYQFDGGAMVYEYYKLLSPWTGGDSLAVQFSVPVDASALGNHTLNCWVKYGSGTTGFTDSLMGYTFQTLLQQNIDVGVVAITSPSSSCSLTANEPVSVKIRFFGCDSLAIGDTIDVAYKVNSGSPITEQFILPANMYPTDTFTYVFNQMLDASTDGTYTIDAWTDYNVDTLNTNDLKSGYVVKNIKSLGTTLLGFEELNASDFFLPITTRYSNIIIKTQAHAPGSAKGLLMTGGNAMTYINLLEMPSGFNTWQINAFLSAKANFCVDAVAWNSVYLKFSLKQTHGGTLYSQYLGGTASDYTIASNLRILADGNQIGGTYNPSTPGSDPFVSHLIDLSSYSGTDFELTFETRNISKDTSIIIPFILDNAYLDNVRFFPGPVALNDTIYLQTDSYIDIPVLTNDNDNAVSALNTTLADLPVHGTAVLGGNTITYTPNALFSGIDSLTYNACYTSDPTVCDLAKVYIHVLQGPIAMVDTAGVRNDSLVKIDILNNDLLFGLPISNPVINQTPLHGTAVINGDLTLTYTPTDNIFLGKDSLSYSICYSEHSAICDEAKVYFRVHNDQSVAGIDGLESINLYPNPLKSKLTIEYSSIKSGKANITITDVVGNVILSSEEHFTSGKNRKVYNLEKEPAGTYFVTIKTDNQRKVYKITKE